MAMPQCSTCKIRFICAGGCAFESFSKGTATPCMPFLSEMTMAWQYYAKSRPELFAD
jgi:sulfatase maturation enzyme AslB (radical SAM superfamily)